MAIDDAVRQKRFVDAMLDSAPLGFDTTGEEDNRMRQTSGDPDDEAAHEAEMTIEVMREVMPYFWRLHDPDELRKLKQELRADSLKRRGVEPEMVTGDPEEEPFNSDKFWNNPDEIQKAVKKVRPPRL